jgi:hypothetical protein
MNAILFETLRGTIEREPDEGEAVVWIVRIGPDILGVYESEEWARKSVLPNHSSHIRFDPFIIRGDRKEWEAQRRRTESLRHQIECGSEPR